MSDPDSIILQVFAEWRRSFDTRLDTMGQAIEQAVNGLGEIKASQRVQGFALDRVLEQTTATNGRVVALEDRVETIVHRNLRLDSIQEGKAELREEYHGKIRRFWSVVWSPAAKVLAAITLLTAGFTLSQIREVWPW